MDPLSNVLSLLKPQNYLAGAFEAGGDWSIQFPDQQTGIKCGAVVSGECWLSVEGAAEPVRLTAGDGFLLPSGRPFRLATDLSLPPSPAKALFEAPRRDGVAICNGGGDFLMVSTRFSLAGDHSGMLLRMLAPIIHIRDPAGRAALRGSVEQMMRELRAPQPGGYLILQHLAHMMLVQALRLHLADGAGTGVGWLFALADKPMNAAISAMHEDPGRRWTLQSLAERAGMSRSAFAQRFKAAVGAAPMDYLTRWRMLLAGERLAREVEPVAAIALSLGYESESAFSTAFKRVTGRSPRQHGRRAAAAPLRQAG